MRSGWRNLEASLLGLLLLVASGNAQFNLDVSHATNNCVRFTFPQWEIQGIYDYSGYGHLEFRTTGDSQEELLVGVRLQVDCIRQSNCILEETSESC